MKLEQLSLEFPRASGEKVYDLVDLAYMSPVGFYDNWEYDSQGNLKYFQDGASGPSLRYDRAKKGGTGHHGFDHVHIGPHGAPRESEILSDILLNPKVKFPGEK